MTFVYKPNYTPKAFQNLWWDSIEFLPAVPQGFSGEIHDVFSAKLDLISSNFRSIVNRSVESGRTVGDNRAVVFRSTITFDFIGKKILSAKEISEIRFSKTVWGSWSLYFVHPLPTV